MAWFDELKKITRPYDDDEEFIENEAPEEEEYTESVDNSEASEFDAEPRKEPVRTSVFTRKERDTRTMPTPEKGKMKLVLKSPESFEDAADIADNLVAGRAVHLNLEATNKDVSRRLIDFLSGVAFALGGRIKRSSAQTYILTPCNVDLVGDSVEELESSGIYF